MSIARRMSVTLLTVGAFSVLLSTTAFAHVCFNPNKPAGAGSAGEITLDVATGEVIEENLDLNPAGHPKGGFITVNAEFGGEPIASVDTFAHITLPDGALNAGPGDDLCDGKGIDNAEACFAP